MNQKEFLDELNKRKDGFLLNQNKYYPEYEVIGWR